MNADSAGSEQLSLDLDAYEGPLDLLLTLARAQKVDLRQISILRLVEQYLAFVASGRLGLEAAADHLVSAAWLTLLKSALLLPNPPEAEDDPAVLAAALGHRLARLEAMREAAARLTARDQLGRDVFARGSPEGLAVERVVRWQATLFDLLRAYASVRERTTPVLHVVARREVTTLEEALAMLAARLAEACGWTDLRALVPREADPERHRSTLASGFAAALELARTGRAELRQAAPFGPLELQRAA